MDPIKPTSGNNSGNQFYRDRIVTRSQSLLEDQIEQLAQEPLPLVLNEPLQSSSSSASHEPRPIPESLPTQYSAQVRQLHNLMENVNNGTDRVKIMHLLNLEKSIGLKQNSLIFQKKQLQEQRAHLDAIEQCLNKEEQNIILQEFDINYDIDQFEQKFDSLTQTIEVRENDDETNLEEGGTIDQSMDILEASSRNDLSNMSENSGNGDDVMDSQEIDSNDAETLSTTSSDLIRWGISKEKLD